MEEYVQAKRSTRVNFQLKMCNLPFTQDVKAKLRDKGYQELQERSKLNLSLKQVRKIFNCGDEKLDEVDTHATEEEKMALKKVHLLGKTVPRNSMRSRWRETGNYQPNLMSKNTHGKLFKGDMVFVSDAENTLEYLIVANDFELTDLSRRLPVLKVGEKKKLYIDLSRLITDKGFLFLDISCLL